jgi:type II secretory pathway pseudopilin PulG
LVELAIVIALLGLLLGTLVVPLSARFQAQKVDNTRRGLQAITEALVGFAIANGRLPCPDRDRDGLEDNPCAGASEGFVPWSQLGVRPTDAWGRLFHYRVAAEFTAAARLGELCNPPNGDMTTPDGVLNLCDEGDITIFTRGYDPGSSGAHYKARIALASILPAVVVSLGSNGSGGTDLAGNVLASPTGADEQENLLDGNGQFVSRIPTRATDPCNDAAEALPLCEFDDLVSWVSANILFYRLVAAGRLP